MVQSAAFILFFFFFSSRRRHTRCSRDWSSDVCSSDLAPPPSRRRATGSRRPGRGVGVEVGGAAIRGYNTPQTRSGRSTLRSEEHTSELQSRLHLVCRLLLEKKKKNNIPMTRTIQIEAPAL